MIKNGAPMTINQDRHWVEISDINLDSDDFKQIGDRFSKELDLERQGLVAMAQTKLIPQKQLVDYAVQWIEKNRE
jgi:aminoglycoside 3-N-acetyltransferase